MTCISNVLTWHLLHVLSFPLSSSYFLSSVLSMDPIIRAISIGNAVVLKPSEISPATSSLLANLIEQYLDNSTIRVVEGAIPETSALLDQKWDKILYTSNVSSNSYCINMTISYKIIPYQTDSSVSKNVCNVNSKISVLIVWSNCLILFSFEAVWNLALF